MGSQDSPHLGDALGMGCCPELRALILEGNLYNKAITSLAQGLGTGGCPKLEVINLSNCDIRGNGIHQLAQILASNCCPNLQTLDVSRNTIDPVGVQLLNALKGQFSGLDVIH